MTPDRPVLGPVVAVIQARMGSSRLPGKVLVPVAGQPLLWHLLHRLKHCRTVDRVVIATSTDPCDDALEYFCAQQDILCVRGSLHNVLDRYRLAAQMSEARIVLRITGDTPFLDPGFVDYLVAGLEAEEGDFVQLMPGALCAHEGVDVMSRRALDWLVAHAADDEIAREHVTSYFKKHPGVVRTVSLPAYAPLARRPERLTVDTPEDLALLRAVYDRLQAPPGEAPLAAVLQLLEDEPDYRAINAHIRQKAVTEVERPDSMRRR